MSIKSDKWIRRMCEQHGMIEPFEPNQVKEVNGQKIVSYGTSSYGYDIRCSREFKLFTNINSTIVDPKNFDPSSFVNVEADYCIIPPNSFALARTVEYFRIPRSVLTVCLGKSTYARCGIIVNVTPFEPEWEGYVTLEFSNTTPLPRRSTPTKAWRKCCSSRATKCARPPTKTVAASIKARSVSPCQRSKCHTVRRSSGVLPLAMSSPAWRRTKSCKRTSSRYAKSAKMRWKMRYSWAATRSRYVPYSSS